MTSNEQVPVRVFGSTRTYADQDAGLSGQVEKIVRERVLSGREAPYYEVKVKVRRDTYAQPKYLIAYLLRSDVYTAEVVRVDVDSELEPENVTFGYDDSDEIDEEDEEPPDDESFDADGLPALDDEMIPLEPESEDEANWEEPGFDVYGVDFVVATPCDGIPTAVTAVNEIYNRARALGLRTVKLIGSSATVGRYKSYMSSGVRGFVNIGHGNPNLIVLADGTLPHTWFNGLSGRPLSPAVIYFNSCQVFNDPLKNSVLRAGARTFIGGIVNLLIGPSEEVCKCFWHSQMTTMASMRTALKDCEKAKYPNEGAHGIGGYTGRFDIARMSLAHAMWAHGHAVQVENPERLVFDRRYGFFARLRGKPFTSTWVHFAIPTPVIVDAKHLHASSVLLRFRTGPGASIGAVHVWDAERRRIANHGGLTLTSGSAFRMARFPIPMRPPVHFGIGVSVLLKFGDDANLPGNKLLVDLSSAGCDFTVPV